MFYNFVQIFLNTEGLRKKNEVPKACVIKEKISCKEF